MRREILSGKLRQGERLPSKRALCEEYGVSVTTVENAYGQLIAEGYVRAAERSGYFVQYSGDAFKFPENKHTHVPASVSTESEPKNTVSSIPASAEIFPLSVWAKLMRTVILEKNSELLKPTDPGGALELRTAISELLRRTRGLECPPKHIIIGAGTEHLYNMIFQLLGSGLNYGIEDPCFDKLAKIYGLIGARFERIPLDEQGIIPAEIVKHNVDAVHISPAHHFPTGIVMPISRRSELLKAAESGKLFIIEDDYDSELRFSGKPLPTMFEMDHSGRVVYVNTFSQTIAPSVRISYMCLSEALYRQWESKLGFYSSPVPAFEQYILARFISDGTFERHLLRSKRLYKQIREGVMSLILSFEGVEIFEENAGLHFTIKVKYGGRQSSRIALKCRKFGIEVTELKSFFHDKKACPVGLYLVNYANADTQLMRESGIIK